jgi:septation ring formation regulator EzrA
MGQLDKAQEFRAQTAEEMLLKQQLNNRIMGLAAIEKSRARQKSRLT